MTSSKWRKFLDGAVIVTGPMNDILDDLAAVEKERDERESDLLFAVEQRKAVEAEVRLLREKIHDVSLLHDSAQTTHATAAPSRGALRVALQEAIDEVGRIRLAFPMNDDRYKRCIELGKKWKAALDPRGEGGDYRETRNDAMRSMFDESDLAPCGEGGGKD